MTEKKNKIDDDVILAKVNAIQNCLRRIHQTISTHAGKWDYDVEDVIVLNLQRAVQATVDIAAHVVSHENYGLIGSLKDLFVSLEKNKVIDDNLSKKMQKMVGFRNIAVHDYQEINVDILRSVVANHLNDFEEFYTAIINHYH
jgi:uncharacterized protein YutE (UPF0331/DUF86 family)